MQKTLFSTLVLASFTPLLQAQETVATLPDVVVTSTRADIQQNQLATASTVYTRQDIERLQVKTLPELLNSAAGVDIAQNGGYGQLANVFMRGTNPDHVLVLIDGIKVGSVTAGTAAFQFIPIDQIERVEIVRGPQSSLYGSEAIGGVIQIFTRSGKNSDTPKFTLEAGVGSYDTYRSSGAVSGKWQNSWYSLGASSIGSNGFSAQTLPSDSDRDGYQNTAVNARLGHRFDNGAELEAFFMRAQGENEFDGFSENKNKFVQQVVGASASMTILDNWQAMLRFGQSADESTNLTPDGNFSSRFDSSRWNVTWLNQFKFSDTQQLVVGADGRVDEVNSTTAFTQKSRYDVGVFAELHSRWFEHHFTNASIRWDKNEAFGDYVTGSFGWRYQWDHGISVLANFGNAFKAPTFNELYWPDTGFGGGNPNLKAEQSRSFEVGLMGDHDWGHWEVRAYHTDVDNLINGWPPVNVDKAQLDGIESVISADVLGWHGKLSMNLLSPKDKTTHARLIRRADKTLSFDISRSFDAVDVGATVLAQSSRPDTDFNAWPARTINIAGYATVDLRAMYHFNKQWSIGAKLNNLLDQDYQTVNNYNMANRNFFFTIHYNN
jgi:vitamin B12 transporter